jgi:hypothetical protein
VSLVQLQGQVQDLSGHFWGVELDTVTGQLKLLPISQNTASNSTIVINAGSQNKGQQIQQKPGDGDGASEGQGQANDTPPALDKINEAFKQRLNSVLTDNKYDRRLPKRRRGKLAMQGLWRVEAGAANVFSQKQARKGKHYNVVLLVDQSSSMSAVDWTSELRDKARELARTKGCALDSTPEILGVRNIDRAAQVAVFLAVHFKALDIDFSVIGYSHKAVKHKILGQDIEPDKLFRSLDRVVGDTHMLPALEEMLVQLKHASGQTLAIIIGDGDTSDEITVKRLIKANKDKIAFFGVGIGGQDMAIIPNHAAVSDINNLQPVILDWLAKNIRRGV